MARPKTINQTVAEENQAEVQSEIMPHHSTKASVDESAGSVDKEAEKETTVELSADLDQVVPAEIAAIDVGNESASAPNRATTTKEQSKL